MLRAQVLVVLPGLDDGENLPALWDRSNDGGRGLLYVYVSEVLAEITLETISDFDRHMCLQMKVAFGGAGVEPARIGHATSEMISPRKPHRAP